MYSSQVSNRRPIEVNVGGISLGSEWERRVATAQRRAARREQEWENVRSGRTSFFLSPEHTPERELRESREAEQAAWQEPVQVPAPAIRQPSLCQRLWSFLFG